MSTPDHLAPAPAGLLTRAAVTFGEVVTVILAALALQALSREPVTIDVFSVAMLVAAAMRIVTETGWGASPGKWLAGIRVKFPGEVRWMRLPQAVLRNTWLWLAPLAVLLSTQEEDLWAMAAAVGVSIILGPDRRSVTDLLAGAYVIDPVAPRRVPDPVDHISPRRALAWAVDMGLAVLPGLALGAVLDWSWWARGLAVPSQVSVLGVDNDDFVCESTKPAISTILVDREKQGYYAAAALDALLRLHLDPVRAVQSIPALSMLAAEEQQLQDRAERLAAAVLAEIPAAAGHIAVVPSVARAGAGALPITNITSRALAVRPRDGQAAAFARRLRLGEPPVLARVQDDHVLLDVLAIRDSEVDETAAALAAALA